MSWGVWFIGFMEVERCVEGPTGMSFVYSPAWPCILIELERTRTASTATFIRLYRVGGMWLNIFVSQAGCAIGLADATSYQAARFPEGVCATEQYVSWPAPCDIAGLPGWQVCTDQGFAESVIHHFCTTGQLAPTVDWQPSQSS